MFDSQNVNYTVNITAGNGAVVLTRLFQNLNQGTQQAVTNANQANQAYRSWLSTASSISVIFTAATGAVNLFWGALKTSISYMRPFADALEGFEEHMNGIKALSTSTAGVVSPLYRQMKQQALDYAGTSKFTATQIAEAQKLILRSGMNEQQTLAVLSTAANMSMGSAGSNLETTTRTLMKAIQTFHIPLKDIAKTGDEITVAVNRSALNMEDLDTAFKTAGGTAQQFGGSLGNMLAFMASVSNEGVKGTQAGTGYRNMFIKLQTATGGAYTELKKFGLEAADVREVGKQLEDVMASLSSQHASPVEMFKVLHERAGGVALSFLSQGIPAFQAMKKAIEESGGAAERAANIQMEGFYGAIVKMRGGLEKAAITIATIFEPQMKGLANLFNNASNIAASFLERLNLQKQFAKVKGWIDYFLTDTKGAVISFASIIGTGLDVGLSKAFEVAGKAILYGTRFILTALKFLSGQVVEAIGTMLRDASAEMESELAGMSKLTLNPLSMMKMQFLAAGASMKGAFESVAEAGKKLSNSPGIADDTYKNLSDALTAVGKSSSGLVEFAHASGLTAEKFGILGEVMKGHLPTVKQFWAAFSTPQMPKAITYTENPIVQMVAVSGAAMDKGIGMMMEYKRTSTEFFKALNAQKFEHMQPQGDSRLNSNINQITDTAQGSFDAMSQGNERALTSMTNSTRRYVANFRQIWFEKNKGQINSDEATSRTSLAVGASLLEGLFNLTVKNGRKRFTILKAAKIAEALANTYTAVTGAYTSVPWPLNIAAAAAQLAAGLAQVNAIRSLDYDSSSGSSSVGGASGGSGGGSGGGSLSDASGGSGGGGNSLTQVDNGRGKGNRNITINVDGFVGNESELASKIGQIIKEGVRDNIDFGLVNSGG